MMHLSIDIETYSSVDLKKSGMYKYVQSPDFEILLLAYSIDGQPVQIIDLAQGEPMPLSLIAYLCNPNVIKHAWNAAFEWYCLNKFWESPLDQWRCTMFHSLYCGLTGQLASTGPVIGLPEDKRKMGIGKQLINIFCKPTKPTNKNGQRTRTRPHHEPEKWRKFKEYCINDVVNEMEVERRLSAFPVPDSEQRLWELDQMINMYGVAVDMELVEGALHCSEVITNELMTEAVQLSGLKNPKSVKQLSAWLTEETGEEVADLQKETVSEMIKATDNDTVRRMLEIRQELSKTSVKKYTAMKEAVCVDGRIRGLLQIYGANRTGRWAGRLVQVQNLPRNHMEALELARQLVRRKQVETLKLIFGNIPDTLSQLIRTAFIPAPGNTFGVADYSAIEARVIAWLAGEQWRLEVFATHGKIYEASASQMFGVPIELIKKGNPEYELRQKGKVAELACIAQGGLVLTNKGHILIEKITTDMLVWDGIEFVRHDGVIYRGIKEVMTYDGLTATADHLVWVEGEAGPIQFNESATRGARLYRPEPSRESLRTSRDHKSREKMEERLERPLRAYKMPPLRISSMDSLLQSITGKIKRLSTLLATKTHTEMVRQEIHSRETTMHKPERSRVSKLRRAWYSILLRFCSCSRNMDDRELRLTWKRNGDRPDRRKWKLRTWKSSVGDTSRELRKSAAVYDIINCGPRNRYTVNGALVHNCGYQGSIGALKAMGADKMGLSDDELLQIIKRWRASNKRIVDLWYSIENAALQVMRTGQPVGIRGLIIARESDMIHGMDFLTITLPSGRKLYYAKPFLAENDRGREALYYHGINQDTKKWEVVPTYGGKLVENIVQAISRDCLAEAIQRLTREGYKVGMHIHDEVIIDIPIHQPHISDDKVFCDPVRDYDMDVCPGACGQWENCRKVWWEAEPENQLEKICKIMGQPISWAPGLLLRADGFITEFYKKD